MKAILAALLLLTGMGASAATLTYKADFTKMVDKDTNVLDVCGFPHEISFDAKDSLGLTFIEKGMFTAPVKIERIQATEGSLVGGQQVDTPYTGAYREKVYIVKQVSQISGYAPGIYYRVQVNTYGPTDAPTGFIVSSELLNHRYSAELGEGSFCGDIYYKLN